MNEYEPKVGVECLFYKLGNSQNHLVIPEFVNADFVVGSTPEGAAICLDREHCKFYPKKSPQAIYIPMQKTPSEMGFELSKKHPVRMAPATGWKESTWYLVEVAFSSGNPVHRKVFYSGFISGKNKEPSGYNQFCPDGEFQYSDCVYLKVVETLFNNVGKRIPY